MLSKNTKLLIEVSHKNKKKLSTEKY